MAFGSVRATLVPSNYDTEYFSPGREVPVGREKEHIANGEQIVYIVSTLAVSLSGPRIRSYKEWEQ
jgi:hypothetical protein